jgi:hypothetical protein
MLNDRRTKAIRQHTRPFKNHDRAAETDEGSAGQCAAAIWQQGMPS